MMDNIVIRRLSSLFYTTYPRTEYPEILEKEDRPYNCVLVNFPELNSISMCIPYRSNISHKYAYHFRNSRRSRNMRSGLDYTKIIIISNLNFIDSAEGVIDTDEYRETVEYYSSIKEEAIKFVNDYIDYYKNKEARISGQEFRRRYGFSPLKYFHDELNIR